MGIYQPASYWTNERKNQSERKVCDGEHGGAILAWNNFLLNIIDDRIVEASFKS